MSAQDDAKVIRNAIKGLGTDDKKLVEVITKRSNDQLIAITKEYTSSFGKSIFDDIKGDTSGDYRTLLISLVEAKPDYIAHVVHNAVKGAGTDEGALIDALAHTPNALIKAAGESYHRLYNKNIVSDVSDDTSGDFKRLLVGILAGARDESPADPSRAEAEAERLYKAGEKRIGTDEDVFIEFFLRHSFAQIAAVNQAYHKKYGHNLGAAIDSEFSGYARRLLKALSQTRSDYWAGRIHKAISGLGTNDAALIRAFVLNNRDQLRQIEVSYKDYNERKKSGVKPQGAKEKKDGHKKDKPKKKTTSGSLAQDIKGDTSGWYEKSLLSLFQ